MAKNSFKSFCCSLMLFRHDSTQRENEERFSMLQREMSSLMAMMEMLLEQNSEREREASRHCSNGIFISCADV